MFKKTVLILALAASACSKEDGTKLSLSARGGPKPAGKMLVQQGATSGDVTIDRVRLVVSQLRLERPAVEGSPAASVELAAGPFVIDLQGGELTGGIEQLFALELEPGEYSQIKYVIHKLEEADLALGPALAELGPISVRIDGSLAGVPFSFVSELSGEQQREGHFLVEEGANNVSLNLDPSGWFVAEGGGTLDPSNLSVKSEIEGRIKSSIAIYEDDDKDGAEDPLPEPKAR